MKMTIDVTPREALQAAFNETIKVIAGYEQETIGDIQTDQDWSADAVNGAIQRIRISFENDMKNLVERIRVKGKND
jgi:hypothetical protein